MRARHLQLLAGITIAGALLRFLTLDVQSYWLDEVATVNILHKGFGHMFSAIASGESTPPLYYVVAWVWAKVFGTGEVGLRSLSALFGTATIPLAFVLGRDLVGRRTGLVAAALCAFNPLLIWYSQEARSYALMILLTGMSLLAFLRALEHGVPRRYVIWALVSVAAVATHYYAGFLVGAEALWLVWRSPVRRRAVFASGAVALLAAALLPLALHQRSTGAAAFISQSSLARRLAQVPKQFAVGYQGPLETAITIAALLLIAYGVVLLVTAARPRDRSRALMFAALGAATILAPFVLAIIGPDYLIARNVIAALLPLAVTLAAGFATRRAGVVAAALLCALGLVQVIGVDTQERYQRDNWRAAGKFIGKGNMPTAVIVTPASGAVPMLHYLRDGRPTPANGAAVKEIAFVGMAARLPGEAPKPPRPPAVGAAGFTEVRRKQGSTYTVVIETSPVGTTVPPQVGASSLDGRPAVTLYQP
ncbi:MAG TPA: glycosyltransferase family 39 protein [Thermoleophilaceae bacterium]|jgi:4-amino-4-deoxy-L-arabinose transferase-like glycosyltransferase|nr:glycosyltransferase family 39 protein [Thermoleophilaceae bacterium]